MKAALINAFGVDLINAFGVDPINAFGVDPINAFGVDPINAFGVDHINAFGVDVSLVKALTRFDLMRTTMAKKKMPAPTPAKKAPPKKVAPALKAPMSKQPAMTHAEVSILSKMATLDEDSPRYRVLESALAFKSSWVILGEHLAEILKNQFYKGWGYASFERFCADELFITSATAKKLVRSFAWIGDEAPEYLPPRSRSELVARSHDSTLPEGPLPDLNAINVLADAKKALGEARVSEDAYLSLKRAALEGENASSLKRSLNEAIPEDLKPKKPDDKVRHLRRALSSTVKTLDELREWDSGGEAAGDDLLIMAENLRDAIALRLPKEA